MKWELITKLYDLGIYTSPALLLRYKIAFNTIKMGSKFFESSTDSMLPAPRFSLCSGPRLSEPLSLARSPLLA